MTVITTRTNAVSALVESRRILVLGSSGSGKSYFSSRLAEVLGIPAIHLDRLFWKPNWVATPADHWNSILAHILAEDCWVMDGTYERTLPLRIPPAQTLIVIDSHRLACLGRVVWRKLTNDGPKRADAPPRQPIDWDYLRYIWHYPSRTRPFIQECIQRYGRAQGVILLKGPKGASLLLELLTSRLGLSA